MYNEYDVDLIWGKTISEKFKMYHRINLKHKVLFLHSKHFFLKLLEFFVFITVEAFQWIQKNRYLKNI